MKNVQLSPEDRARLIAVRNDVHQVVRNRRNIMGETDREEFLLDLIKSCDKVLSTVNLGQTRTELAKNLKVNVNELDDLYRVTVEEEGGESDVNVQACLRECLDY